MIDLRLPRLPGAACAEADPEAWFPDNDGDAKVPGLWEINGDGKGICRDLCPVKDDCLREARA